MVGDPVHLGEPFLADLVEERPQPVFVQPGRRFRQVGDGGSGSGGSAGVRSPRTAGSRSRGPSVADLDGEHPFVDDVPEAIDDAGAVEVDAAGRFVCQREEARPLLEVLLRLSIACAGGPPRTAGGRA